MLADLVDLLARNGLVIPQLNNHLFSSCLIPNAVHNDVQNSFLPSYDRANKMMNTVLATLECHSNPNSVFTSLITALHKVGLTTIATKLMECFSKCMHASLIILLIIINCLIGKKGGRIDVNLGQTQAVNDQPLQLVGTAPAAQPLILCQIQLSSFTSPEPSSKSEVASNIGNLHSCIASLNSEQTGEFEELLERVKYIKLKTIARNARSCMFKHFSLIYYSEPLIVCMYYY